MKKNNEELLLTPISKEERKLLEELNLSDNLFILYRSLKDDEIRIGMLSKAIREYFPELANLKDIQDAVDLAFFAGCPNNKKIDIVSIDDRPVYWIKPSNNRTVSEYYVANKKTDNSMNIWLEDVIDGKYQVDSKSFSFRGMMK